MIKTRPPQGGTIRNYNLAHKHNSSFKSEQEKEKYIYKYINMLDELGFLNEKYTHQKAYNALKICKDKNRMSQIFKTIKERGEDNG